jgi:hypothetical protein
MLDAQNNKKGVENYGSSGRPCVITQLPTISGRAVQDGVPKAKVERTTLVTISPCDSNKNDKDTSCLPKDKAEEDNTVSVFPLARCYYQDQAVALNNEKAPDTAMLSSR